MGRELLFGARIERGVVVKSDGEGVVVKSSDRDGIVTPPVKSLDGGAYQAGDSVWFFLFADGDGAVVGMR